MRRRPGLLAALGAGAVVAVCSVVVVTAVAVAASRHEERSLADARVPPDLAWPWVEHCAREVGVDTSTVMGWYTSNENGVIDVEFGTMDGDGQMTVDEPITAAVNSCAQTRELELELAGQSYRPATTAERLELYDWTLAWQRPCLAARGIETDLPSLRDFLNDQTVPWYLLQQYIWDDPDPRVTADFDALLEARLACPPMPAHLAAQGVGW